MDRLAKQLLPALRGPLLANNAMLRVPAPLVILTTRSPSVRRFTSAPVVGATPQGHARSSAAPSADTLPSFDDLSSLFGREVADFDASVDGGRTGHQVHDFFFEQPVFHDETYDQASKAELDGAYTRHVYVNRRETPVASSLASTINFKDLFEDSMPLDEPAGPAYFKRRSSDLFAVRPDELAGVDMEANPPEIDAEFKRHLTDHARPLLEKLMITKKA